MLKLEFGKSYCTHEFRFKLVENPGFDINITRLLVYPMEIGLNTLNNIFMSELLKISYEDVVISTLFHEMGHIQHFVDYSFNHFSPSTDHITNALTYCSIHKESPQLIYFVEQEAWKNGYELMHKFPDMFGVTSDEMWNIVKKFCLDEYREYLKIGDVI